jgi:hypothetical protein
VVFMMGPFGLLDQIRAAGRLCPSARLESLYRDVKQL